VLVYVRLGGYKAIVKTDSWQIFLVILSTSAIFIFSFIVPKSGNIHQDVLTGFFVYTENPVAVFLFVLWVSFNNMAVSFTQLSFWQRVVASSSTESSWQGLKKSTFKTLFVWSVPIISFIVIRMKGYTVNDLQSLLLFVRNFDSITSIVLFPIIVVGFAAALFSSADVAVIAVIHSLFDQNTFITKVKSFNYSVFKRYLTSLTILLLAVLTVIYWVKYFELSNYFIPLIYTSLGQMTCVFPLSIYAIYKLSRNEYPVVFNKEILFLGVLFGWFSVLLGVYLNVNYNSQGLQQIAILFGAFCILFSIYLSLIFNKYFFKNKLKFVNKIS
jgi:hypothetical protein